MGFIHINPGGYYTTVFIDADMICEIEKLATHLSPIDENELLEQANQTFREAKCDCALSLAYRLYVSEYKGEKYAVLSCLIRPDNKNPEDHHHDYVNNQFNVFLELNE